MSTPTAAVSSTLHPPIGNFGLGSRPAIIVSMLQCIFFFSSAAAKPWFSLWFTQAYGDGTVIGLLTAVSPLAALLSGGVWGHLVDRTGMPYSVLGFMMTVGTVFRLILMLTLHNTPVQPNLWLLTGLLVLSEVCVTPGYSVIDAASLYLLGPHRRHLYGRIRMWGAVGWGSGAAVAGWLADMAGMPALMLHVAASTVLAVGLAMYGHVLSQARRRQVEALRHPELLPPAERTPSPVASAPASASPAQGFRAVVTVLQLAHIRWMLLLVASMGMVYGSIVAELFPRIHQLHGAHIISGLSLTITCVAETPVMAYSGMLIQRAGILPLLALVLAAYGTRLVLYYFTTDPGWILAIEPLHGITFGLGWPSSVHYADEYAPPAARATVQGMLGSTYAGLGVGAGAILAGVLSNYLALSQVFLAMLGCLVPATIAWARLATFRRADILAADAEVQPLLQKP